MSLTTKQRHDILCDAANRLTTLAMEYASWQGAGGHNNGRNTARGHLLQAAMDYAIVVRAHIRDKQRDKP